MLSEINLLCFSGAKLNKRFEIACILSKKRQKKLHAYQSSKKKMRSKHVQCLSHWYINYISFTYLSPPIHIYITTRLHINEVFLQTPYFSQKKEKRDKQIKLLISLIGSEQTYLLIPYQRIRQYP